MRNRVFATFVAVTALIALVALAQPLLAQNAQRAQPPARPAPRLPDGRVNFGAPPGEKGFWLPNGRPILATPDVLPGSPNFERFRVDGTGDDPQGRAAPSGPTFPGKPKESEVPFQPWARAIYQYRETNLFEPYIRCKPSGGARLFINPFGVEFVDMPELQTILQFDGNLHSYRVIYMDGRPHPKDLVPSYYGHSVGHWEKDMLVVDTIGYNERFWIDREGMPHTEQLHLIERFTRTDFNTMKYEMTIDDPGAYTRPWTTGFFLRWSPEEMLEFICQENNQVVNVLGSPEQKVDRGTQTVP